MAHSIPSPHSAAQSHGTSGGRSHLPGQLPAEGEHQLEKLQFSLAVALTRGDHHRSAQLREQIAALGGGAEEPGT